MDRVEVLAKAETFFCTAMATNSYASGDRPRKMKHHPDWKGYEYRDGDWRLVDMYHINPDSERSVGQTFIWHAGMLIWMMSYSGWYAKEAIPCLKLALLRPYQMGIFCAGRGLEEPIRFGDHTYHLLNFGQGTFEKFTAHEWITHPKEPGKPEVIQDGQHDIMGYALI